MILLLFGLMILNFGISVFNAWSVGRSWIETRQMGGLPRFMAWMGAIMSASGFTWVYLVVLALIVQSFGYLPMKYIQAMLSLGYLVIIGPVLGSGLAITVQSWSYFWRERSLKRGAISGWNTFAQLYNTYEAISAVPDALKSVMEAFKDSDSDSDNKYRTLVILLVICALLGGALTTALIIRATSRAVAEQFSYRRFGQQRYPAM